MQSSPPPPSLSAYDNAFSIPLHITAANYNHCLVLVHSTNPRLLLNKRIIHLFVFWGDVLLNKTKFASANYKL